MAKLYSEPPLFTPVMEGYVIERVPEPDRERKAPRSWFVHRYEVWQEYGGPEEGGWWYTQGEPAEGPAWLWYPLGYRDEEEAYARCREMNDAEHARREAEESHGFTSVMSARGTFFTFTVEDTVDPTEYPVDRPYYE